MNNATPNEILVKSQENLKQAQNDYHDAIDSLNETFTFLSKKASNSNEGNLMKSAINNVHMLVTNHGQNFANNLDTSRKNLLMARQALKKANLNTSEYRDIITMKENALVVNLTNVIEEKTAMAKEKTKLFQKTFGS